MKKGAFTGSLKGRKVPSFKKASFKPKTSGSIKRTPPPLMSARARGGRYKKR